MGKYRYNYDDEKIKAMLMGGNYTIKDIAEFFHIPYQSMRNHVLKLIKKHNEEIKRPRIPNGYRAITSKEEFVKIVMERKMKREIKRTLYTKEILDNIKLVP